MSKITDTGGAGRKGIQSWFGLQHNALLLDEERRRIGQRLACLFGYHIVQFGMLGDEHFLNSSRITHKLVARLDADAELLPTPGFNCDSAKMPLAAASVDVLLLPHVLEFEADPHQVLREAERVLISEGYLLIIGFNPWSLWGLARLLAWRRRNAPPWCGRYIGVARLKDWLQLLNFEVCSDERFYFRPPLRNLGLLKKFACIERLGPYGWPRLGGVYLLTAKKRTAPLTPIKLRWRPEPRPVTTEIAGASSRTTSSSP